MDIAKIDGKVLTSDDLVIWLKLSGRFGQVIEEMIKLKVTANAAQKAGIVVSGEELQQSADQTRRALGLHRAAETNAFFDDSGVSLEDFENYLTDQLLSSKMRDRIHGEEPVADYFKLHAPSYDAADVSHMAVSDEDQANEIVSLISEGEESFAELAMQYSETDTARLGGNIGMVYRGQLGPELEGKIFSAEEGQPVGPLKAQEGDRFEIFMVNQHRKAELDSITRSNIENQLYSEWLGAQARALNVQV